MGVQQLVDATQPTEVILGATGGLREAVAEGKVSSMQVASLLSTLHELAPRASFRVLDGDEEARAELTAVQYVAESSLPAEAPRPVGMLSGGGMTCQVAHYCGSAGRRTQPSLLSLVAGLNDATSHMRHAPRAQDSLATFRSQLAARVTATGLRGQLGHGTFAVIEMPGGLGSATEYRGAFCELSQRIGQRLLTKSELAAELRAHLDRWAEGTPGALPDDEPSGDEPSDDAPSGYIATLPAELLELLELFDDTARLYVCRKWPSAHGELVPDWSLGLYLASIA